MRLTTNYSLKKPEGSDVVNIDDLNYNADIIDNVIHEVRNKINSFDGSMQEIQVEINDFDSAIQELKNRLDNLNLDNVALLAKNVKMNNGTTVEYSITALQNELGTYKSTLEANINSITGVL